MSGIVFTTTKAPGRTHPRCDAGAGHQEYGAKRSCWEYDKSTGMHRIRSLPPDPEEARAIAEATKVLAAAKEEHKERMRELCVSNQGVRSVLNAHRALPHPDVDVEVDANLKQIEPYSSDEDELLHKCNEEDRAIIAGHRLSSEVARKRLVQLKVFEERARAQILRL